LMFEACATYKLKHGTRALAEALARDSGAAIRRVWPVAKIEHETRGAVVVNADGRAIEASAVIVTAPLGALGRIEFSPPLSALKRGAVAEGQASRGLKAWVRVRGRMRPWLGIAPSDQPLTLIQYEYEVDGDSLLVAFGPDARRLSPHDQNAVQHAISGWLPDAEVVGSTGHDWVADEFAGETWPMLRPGQLTRYLAELQQPEDSVFLAGSDYASGWMGFIDGAIESALTAARHVRAYLADLTDRAPIHAL
jgi:monoamine oxidase